MEGYVTIDDGYFSQEGEGFFSLGVNYMPTTHGAYMWQEWDGEEAREVERDLTHLKEIGIDSVRVPLFWDYFSPQRGSVNPEALQRLDDFLDIAERVGIYVAPVLVVGQMSGTLYGPDWVQRENGVNMGTPLDVDLYSEDMLSAQEEYVGAIAARFKDHHAISMWVLGNEQEAYQLPPSPEKGEEWTRRLTSAVRRSDPNHLVVHGLDNPCMLKEVNFHQREYGDMLDALTTHFYTIYDENTMLDDAWAPATRHKYLAAFSIAMASKGDAPVHLEEFGTTLATTDERFQAVLYRQTVASALMYGAASAWTWCAKDFTPIRDRLPYRKEPFELEFGLIAVDADGKERDRPVVDEVRRARQLADALGGPGEYRRPAPEAAIVVPRFYYENVDTMAPVLYNAFCMARMAGIDVAIVDEGDIEEEGALDGYRLVLLPSPILKNTGVVSTVAWDRLDAFVKDGGSLYLSWGNPGAPKVNEMFGVQVGYERLDTRPMSLDVDLGKGPMTLAYDGLERDRRAKVGILEATTGRVLGRDADGNPAVVVNDHGRGHTMLVTAPVEYHVSQVPNAFATDEAYTLYRHAAELAGITPAYRCDDRFVDVAHWEHRDGDRDVVFLRNLTSERRSAAVASSGTVTAAYDLESGDAVALDHGALSVELEPDEVMVLQVEKG